VQTQEGTRILELAHTWGGAACHRNSVLPNVAGTRSTNARLFSSFSLFQTVCSSPCLQPLDHLHCAPLRRSISSCVTSPRLFLSRPSLRLSPGGHGGRARRLVDKHRVCRAAVPLVPASSRGAVLKVCSQFPDVELLQALQVCCRCAAAAKVTRAN